MPAGLRVIVSRAGSGVNFIAKQSLRIFFCEVAQHYIVVMQFNFQFVFSGGNIIGDIKLEGGKKALVHANEAMVEMYAL